MSRRLVWVQYRKLLQTTLIGAVETVFASIADTVLAGHLFGDAALAGVNLVAPAASLVLFFSTLVTAAANGLEKAVVYRTAINPDGTLYPIPSISIPGYKEVLYGANDPTGKDGWQPIPSCAKMEESGYHFFKYVLERE